MVHPRTPVLIGAGQRTWRGGDAPDPVGMLAAALAAAAEDAGVKLPAGDGPDLLAVVGFTLDATPGRGPQIAHPPLSLAERMGLAPRRMVYSTTGGNTPQALVNWASEEIAEGRADFVALVGAEYLASFRRALAAGGDMGRFAAAGPAPERWGDGRPGCTVHEAAHGLGAPAHVYPLFENALRAKLGRSAPEHSAALGALFAPFTKVAAANPYSWFPVERSPAELTQESASNRMVGFPYTKLLNAIIQVDQAAAVILCSTERADALGVAPGRRVYLYGCADAADLWNPLDRLNYTSSPAIRACAEDAFAMAKCDLGAVDYLDLYSCFPVAVEIAAAELGLALDDPRGLTLTGGLPYFGGPGNNYVMHSIAEALARVRAAPERTALVTANGWFLTKHAFGLYSGAPTEGPWRRGDPKATQRKIDVLAAGAPTLIEQPSGPATIETYTVAHARDGAMRGIVIGRDEQGRRFVANTPDDDAMNRALKQEEGVGRHGIVTSGREDGRTIFELS